LGAARELPAPASPLLGLLELALPAPEQRGRVLLVHQEFAPVASEALAYAPRDPARLWPMEEDLALDAGPSPAGAVASAAGERLSFLP